MEDYIILEKCGEGTYGSVFKAIHKYTSTLVALKKVTNVAKEEGTPVEIKYLKQLRYSSNIVHLKDHFYYNNDLFIVMEFITGDLWKIMSNPNCCLSLGQIKVFTKQLLEAVNECHAKGIMHRDIKPANLLINNDGELKLTDFGLSTSFLKKYEQVYSNNVVSLYYRPPELLLGSYNYGPEIDIWSVGCILMEMITSTYLFAGSNESDQLDLIFRLFGTPNEKTWPGVSSLSGWNSSVIRSVYPVKSLTDKFPHLQLFVPVLDLASKMLVLDPKKRINSFNALNHQWFKSNDTSSDHLVPSSKSFIMDITNHFIHMKHQDILYSPESSYSSSSSNSNNQNYLRNNNNNFYNQQQQQTNNNNTKYLNTQPITFKQPQQKIVYPDIYYTNPSSNDELVNYQVSSSYDSQYTQSSYNSNHAADYQIQQQHQHQQQQQSHDLQNPMYAYSFSSFYDPSTPTNNGNNNNNNHSCASSTISSANNSYQQQPHFIEYIPQQQEDQQTNNFVQQNQHADIISHKSNHYDYDYYQQLNPSTTTTQPVYQNNSNYSYPSQFYYAPANQQQQQNQLHQQQQVYDNQDYSEDEDEDYSEDEDSYEETIFWNEQHQQQQQQQPVVQEQQPQQVPFIQFSNYIYSKNLDHQQQQPVVHQQQQQQHVLLSQNNQYSHHQQQQQQPHYHIQQVQPQVHHQHHHHQQHQQQQHQQQNHLGVHYLAQPHHEPTQPVQQYNMVSFPANSYATYKCHSTPSYINQNPIIIS